jgi:hypothetical protein
MGSSLRPLRKASDRALAEGRDAAGPRPRDSRYGVGRELPTDAVLVLHLMSGFPRLLTH